jgi:hypothetical protein
MARFLFTSTQGNSPWAGSEELWFQAATHLAVEGHHVAAILPRAMQVPETIQRLISVNIRALRNSLDVINSVRVRLARRRAPEASSPFAPVVRHKRRWKADVVVLSQASCWGAYSEMLALAELGIPYVSISQLNTPFNWPGDTLGRRPKCI